jgi:hypothetical protein
MEYKSYPFYGVQFHIEKDQFERKNDNKFLSRDPDNIRFTHTFMMNFVEKLRPLAKGVLDIPVKVLGFSSKNRALVDSLFYY